jgi:hypothetical protein
MTLAKEDVKMLQYTSAEITAPFLLPEMVPYYFLCISSIFIHQKLPISPYAFQSQIIVRHVILL